ncbi:hypothetical protein [Sulfuriflexus sp.]|uniref:hypothetical protein n=1 Tax=Sulfuriflexus sp. TaxID=2015443 RepID=UPI0028CCFC17|nr:hypothetical protein [Sulfuriflexus sp.]MDT8403469.1 hypothetical protein [Sulfuriflexus sp.]
MSLQTRLAMHGHHGHAVPTATNSEPSNAPGLPEVPGSTSLGACSGTPTDCPFVSPGDGGNIVLKLTGGFLVVYMLLKRRCVGVACFR